jgi:hypothetical protein
VPCQAEINHVQIHVPAGKSHDSDEPLRTVPLAPAEDDVSSGYLTAQLVCAGLAPGLVLLGSVDPGQVYPVLSVCDLEDDGVTINNTDDLACQMTQVSRVAEDGDLSREKEHKQ